MRCLQSGPLAANPNRKCSQPIGFGSMLMQIPGALTPCHFLCTLPNLPKVAQEKQCQQRSSIMLTQTLQFGGASQDSRHIPPIVLRHCKSVGNRSGNSQTMHSHLLNLPVHNVTVQQSSDRARIQWNCKCHVSKQDWWKLYTGQSSAEGYHAGEYIKACLTLSQLALGLWSLVHFKFVACCSHVGPDDTNLNNVYKQTT